MFNLSSGFKFFLNPAWLNNVAFTLGGGILGTIGSVVGIASGVKGLLGGSKSSSSGGGGSSSAPGGSSTTNITNPMPADLTPGITVGVPVPIHLAGEFSPNPQIYSTDQKYADGGYVPGLSHFDYLSNVNPEGYLSELIKSNYLAEGGMPNSLRLSNVGLGSLLNPAPNEIKYSAYAEGGNIDHKPEFYSEGGLKNTYVKGSGDGTSDSVPAMLANGEFVIPADVVSSLGNGSSDSGSKVLDEFLKVIRDHKSNHDASKLPPDSKGALTYLSIATKKVK